MKPTLTLLTALLLVPLIVVAAEPSQSPPAGLTPAVTLKHARGRWVLGAKPDQGVTYLGLDSEGTGREKANLLWTPARLAWEGNATPNVRWQLDERRWIGMAEGSDGKPAAVWTIEQRGDDLIWRLEVAGAVKLRNPHFELSFNPLITPTTVLPAKLDGNRNGLGPWLLAAPDFGHLRIESEGVLRVISVLEGRRGGGGAKPQATVGPPLSRNETWRQMTASPAYKPSHVVLKLRCQGTLAAGQSVELRFQPVELSTPAGVDAQMWQRLRRPYLAHWQPCSTSSGPQRTAVLANNGLSDPASCSLFYYSEPMLLWREPVPGVDVAPLLRHSLDYWLRYQVMRDGHVNAFFEKGEDIYLMTSPALLIAAWHYWTLTHDKAWLQANVEILHRIAAFVARRDEDHDGLVESLRSGNAWSLRDPDRADVWYEWTNFGGKNAYTNALTYRAWDTLRRKHADAAARLRLDFTDRLERAARFAQSLPAPTAGKQLDWQAITRTYAQMNFVDAVYRSMEAEIIYAGLLSPPKP